MSSPTYARMASTFAALADETRWEILTMLGQSDQSASALAHRLPVSRQAIAKHLVALESVGLVEAKRVGREIRYQAIGGQLSRTAHALERIGQGWDRRLVAIKDIAESAER